MLEELIGGPVAFVLVLARSAGLVWGLAWLAGASAAGMRGKLAASALVAAAVSPMVGERVASPGDPIALGGSALIELAIGLALGIGAGLIAASARLAGDLIGMQAGLSASSTLAPGAGPNADLETPIATLTGLIALATFAALDGPLRLTIALAETYAIGSEPSPLSGVAHVVGSGPEAIARSAFGMIGQAIGLALWLAAPVALSMLVAQCAVGVLVRASPALSSFTTWLPFRLALGLGLLLVGLSGIVVGLGSAWSTMLGGWG